MNPFIMHINYCEVGAGFGGKTADDICKKAANWGYDGIEFRGKLPADLTDTTFDDYIEAIADAKKKYGLSHILFSIAPSGCTSDDKETRVNAVKTAIEKYAKVNKVVGTTLCNSLSDMIMSKIPNVDRTAFEYHGSAVATPEQVERLIDSYRKIGSAIEPLGMRVAFETHPYCIHDTPEFAVKIVKEIDSPAVGINMDFGNTVFLPVHIKLEEAIDLYGDKLFYTHLKNSVGVPGLGKRLHTLLSDGDINHREYLEKLKIVGYTGPIGIEAPRGGDREWFARQDLAYAKTVLSEI